MSAKSVRPSPSISASSKPLPPDLRGCGQRLDGIGELTADIAEQNQFRRHARAAGNRNVEPAVVVDVDRCGGIDLFQTQGELLPLVLPGNHKRDVCG